MAQPPLVGLGLTPRLFEALRESPDACIGSVPATYVPAIKGHVQSVRPSKNVMAEYWCPVVVEDADGARRVLHADPLAIRKFRRSVANELRETQEKRQRLLKRIKNIRAELPGLGPRDVAERLENEAAAAEARAGEALLRPLPAAGALHVLVEAGPCMVQLELVCARLAAELPAACAAAGVRTLHLEALGGAGATGGEDNLPATSLQGVDCSDARALDEALSWLRSLGATRGGHGGASPRPPARGLRLAGALRRAATADALLGGGGALLLAACSPPADLERCVECARRSELVLQLVGVFGTSPEDPEPPLRRLAEAAADGSATHLFFGPEYWTKYAAACRRKLRGLSQRLAAEPAPAPGEDEDEGEVIDGKVFQMRLIERVLRECYAEEQRCEEELRCAARLLDRTLVDPQEVRAAMREQGQPC